MERTYNQNLTFQPIINRDNLSQTRIAAGPDMNRLKELAKRTSSANNIGSVRGKTRKNTS